MVDQCTLKEIEREERQTLMRSQKDGHVAFSEVVSSET